MTINQVMRKVPGNQQVDVRKYIGDERLELADAHSHCEFLRNNCCIDFDRTYEVYGIEVRDGILTVLILPPCEITI